ncbi:MAG: low molecular weight protein arginine phosphatase [Elusimicrobia bacterium]|nr:low molecular weight protein arginine phosphatase [Elusimicrobiota bacterium]
MAKRIIFVCTGNICRSVMAEHILKKILKEKGISDIMVSSRGTEANLEYRIYGYLADVMKGAGIDFSNHTSTQITEEDVKNSYLILVMEKRHKEFLQKEFPQIKNKIFMLKEYEGEGEIDIVDPIGLPPPAHKQKLEEIETTLHKILPKICIGL